jgi:ankyrin repeat protein
VRSLRLAAALCAVVLPLGAWGGEAENAALLEAVRGQRSDAALAALASGASPGVHEPDGTTALHYAAHYGDARVAAALLRAKADPNARNEFGATPLGEAAEIGSTEVIRDLLKARAEVEAPNPEGQTALMAVARTGNVEAAKLLLKAGAKADARENWGGQTALMWAAARGHADMIRLLVKAGADVNARGAVRDWQRRVTSEPRPKGMNRGGFTPLLYAAREDCLDCAKALLAAGADINLADPDRTTPLLLAIMNFRFEMASLLIGAGADVDKWDLYGQTPLYVAIDMNTLPRGGRPDLPTEDHISGLDVARLLLAAGANPNLQLKLRPPYRNYIFDRGGDQVLSTGATPLLRAAKGGDIPAVKLLLEYRALVDLPNEDGVTPLMVAAGMGHGANPTRGRYKTDAEAAECSRLLIAAGAAINGRARGQLTALHSAAMQGWDGTLKVLVEQGAELEAEESKGLTPIDYAAGRYDRAFLAPEPKAHESTIALLRDYVVKATGRPPKEHVGAKPRQTRGTGAAPSTASAP